MSRRLEYLAPLDGLRAIAVTAVVLYHLDIGWARGGFLGVDLFFVISGFLITTLLLREHDDTGSISLGSFWIRRFKRLVPPLVVMIAATIVATRVWGIEQQRASVRWDAAAALAYVANWRFIFGGQSYFDTLLGPSPLLHTWSLAVEEQWYIVWPIAMVGLAALVARRRFGTQVALGLVVAAAIASAIWMSVLYVAGDPSRAYYGTDTRAQQLLIGAALAWLVQLRPGIARFGERTDTAVATLAALGVFMVAISFTHDDASWLYHGGLFVISLLCAVLVLGSATSRVAAPLRWLSWRPLLWTGRRSYGIYLWHWPVILFVGASMGIDLPRTPLIVLQVTVTLVLADLSHRLVERPTRLSSWRPGALVAVWSVTAALAVVACFVVLKPPAGPDLSDVAFITPEMITGESTTTAPPPGTAPSTDDSGATTTSTVAPRPPTMLLLGDSTAFRLAVNRERDSSGDWDLFSYALTGCGVFDGDTIDSDSTRPNATRSECATWRERWTEKVDYVHPHVAVIMVGAWEVLDRRIDGADMRFPSAEWTDEVRREFTDAVAIAGSTGAQVAVMSVPCMETSGDDQTTARTDPARVAAVNAIIDGVVAATPGATVFDLAGELCPDGLPLETIGDQTVRYDGVHLSDSGVAYVWRWLVPRLDAFRAQAPDTPK